MAAISGRDLIIRRGATAIAGVRSKTVAIDNSPVDITSDDDAGFRKLGSFAGIRSLNLSVEGVWTDQILSDIASGAQAGLMLTDIEIDDGEDTITGDFYLATFERAGSHDADVTYTAELQSSGAWTVTANA